MNTVDYVQMRGDIPLAQSPFNEIDVMALSVYVSLDMSEITYDSPTVAQVYERYIAAGRADNATNESSIVKERLMEQIARARRYKKVRIISYDRIIDETRAMTFYAMQLQVGFFRRVAVFRGTDGSLVSWKENFTTIYEFPTPGQTMAADYISGIKLRLWEKLIVCGHSKGGNLACYGSAYADETVRRRISDIYIFDGPGFNRDLSGDPCMRAIRDKVHAYMPKSAVVGRLMEVPYTADVVESDGRGIYQHDMYTWQVGKDELIRAEGTDELSDGLSTRINNWISSIPMNDREKVVDELFDVFERAGIQHADQLVNLGIKTIINLVKGIRSLSPANVKLLIIILREVTMARP